jgi:hypothetical protein
MQSDMNELNNIIVQSCPMRRMEIDNPMAHKLQDRVAFVHIRRVLPKSLDAVWEQLRLDGRWPHDDQHDRLVRAHIFRAFFAHYLDNVVDRASSALSRAMTEYPAVRDSVRSIPHEFIGPRVWAHWLCSPLLQRVMDEVDNATILVDIDSGDDAGMNDAHESDHAEESSEESCDDGCDDDDAVGIEFPASTSDSDSGDDDDDDRMVAPLAGHDASAAGTDAPAGTDALVAGDDADDAEYDTDSYDHTDVFGDCSSGWY